MNLMVMSTDIAMRVQTVGDPYAYRVVKAWGRLVAFAADSSCLGKLDHDHQKLYETSRPDSLQELSARAEVVWRALQKSHKAVKHLKYAQTMFHCISRPQIKAHTAQTMKQFMASEVHSSLVKKP